jgi:hypothetical protein
MTASLEYYVKIKAEIFSLRGYNKGDREVNTDSDMFYLTPLIPFSAYGGGQLFERGYLWS